MRKSWLETKGLFWALQIAVLVALVGNVSAKGIVIAPCDSSLGEDGANMQVVNVLSVTHDPAPICSGLPVSFLIEIVVMAEDLVLRNASAHVLFCHRQDDCMFVAGPIAVDNVCSLMVHDYDEEDVENRVGEQCKFELGRIVRFNVSMTLPAHMFRGSYDLRLRVDTGKSITCLWFSDLNIVSGHFGAWLFDYASAAIGFVTASASSYVLGQYFPKLTRGLIPQITGFVLLGVVVGPYVTNFVSRFYVYLLESMINRLSLGFIALAAGAEIYLPHLTGLLVPIMSLVTGVTMSTFFFIGGGMIIAMHVLAIPLIGSTPELISYTVIVLMASLMVARSPSSAVAVVQELHASRSQAAKIMIGATVISDLVVLVLFSICTNMCSVEQSVSTIGTILKIALDLCVSVAYGLLWSFPIKWLLEWWPYKDEKSDHRESENKRKLSDMPFVLLLKSHDWRVVIKGAILFCMIFCMRESERLFKLINVRIEPLLVPFFASCYVVHIGVIRRQLHRILASWMPTVFLPFFTLTGASLNLEMVVVLLPWALLIAALRFFAIHSGAAASSWATDRPLSETRWMGITLISQAGISLGLALEVQSQFTWGRDFSSLVIAIVVINQLLGPILCKIGMRKMMNASDVIAPRTSEESRLESADAVRYSSLRNKFSQTSKMTFVSPHKEDASRITSSYGAWDDGDSMYTPMEHQDMDSPFGLQAVRESQESHGNIDGPGARLRALEVVAEAIARESHASD